VARICAADWVKVAPLMVARSAAETAPYDKVTATVAASARLNIIKVFLKTGWNKDGLP
jgi:hypothetical protein